MIVVILQVESGNMVMFSLDKITILMTILNARQTSLGIITKQVFPQLLRQLMVYSFFLIDPMPSVYDMIYKNCST